ncbi:hypothetical protein JCM8202v2_004408 [Rhodotorula sphaerocarpa]
MSEAATARKPKLAELFLQAHERKPQPLSGSHAHFVESQFEVEDASSYTGALLAFEGIIDRLHHPSRHHIRMLLSLCFFPLFFRPPVQASHAAARPSARPASSSAKSSSSRIAPLADDPLVLSQRQIRELARDLLADVIGTSGVEVVCDALKGYGMPEREYPSEDLLADQVTATKRGGGGKYFKKKSKLKLGEDHPDYEEPVEADDPLSASSNRLLEADDLWEVLAGGMARTPRLRTAESPVLDTGGWEVIRELVHGWEAEAERKRGSGEDDALPEPMSLLRYFKPSASAAAARELSTKALDVVFWPFSDYAPPLDESEGGAEEEGEDAAEDDESDLESLDVMGGTRKRAHGGRGSDSARTKREKLEADGTSLADKRETAVRLFGLIGECAVAGYLGSKTVASEFTHRLKGLSHRDLVAFLETSASVSPCPTFFSRILWSFLETHSHSVSATTLLRSTEALVEPHSDQSISPRKLAAQAGSGSLNGAPSRSSSTSTAYWHVPGINSSEFLRVVASVPIEVPLPPSAGSRASTLPRTFTRAEEAAEVHLVVKHLLSDILAHCDGQECSANQRRRIEEALSAVEAVVEAARTRVQG